MFWGKATLYAIIWYSSGYLPLIHSDNSAFAYCLKSTWCFDDQYFVLIDFYLTCRSNLLYLIMIWSYIQPDYHWHMIVDLLTVSYIYSMDIQVYWSHEFHWPYQLLTVFSLSCWLVESVDALLYYKYGWFCGVLVSD